ncbi:hypothetical protein PLESTF_001241600 [Pleodorina starrii]|nr:hypothetical protein PLESTF_001241600 [Pleodorina starrii]
MFDQVLPETTAQQDVFELAGLVAVDNCLAGYNSSIFAYGQTGAGKTFTVIGNISCPEKRGLAPRVFEYLFAKITDHENARGPDAVKYNCRCAFLEIYNETIADLLCPSSSNLPIREDPEKGPYVDGLSEPPALNVDEMLQHLLRGAENRHTGETRLNRESSRSHSVFMCTVEKTVTSNGISKCFYAKLNLVDLAGSERIASGAHGGSNAAGEHFKEACHINKSLTALGRVTTELVKSQKNGGGGHVPYRDSKLTFLLQSSLGGNAKTLIIANVSPSSICAHETLSTLRFAKQTKHIRNDAKVNWTVQGDRIAMQREIERLRMELAGMRSGITEPLVQANEELTARLEEERQRREELQQERERMVSALNQARRENRLLDQRLVGLAAISGMDGSRGGAMATAVQQLEAMDANALRRRTEIDQAQQELMALQLQFEKESRARLMEELQAAINAREDIFVKCALLETQLASLLKEKAELEESCSVLAENFSQAGLKISEQKEQLSSQLTNLHTAEHKIEELQRQLDVEREEREKVEQLVADSSANLQAAMARQSELQALLDDKHLELSQQESRIEGLERQLEGALSEVHLLQRRLAEAQEQLAQTRHDADKAHFERSQLQSELSSALDQLAARDRREAELEQQLMAKAEECSSALLRLTVLEGNLSAQAEACSSLSSRLESAEARCDEQAELLCRAQQNNANLQAQVSSSAAEVERADKRTASARQEVSEMAARIQALEGDVAGYEVARAMLEDTLQGKESTLAQLEATVVDLRVQLCSAQDAHAASEQQGTELRAAVAALEARAAELETQVSKQAADLQDRGTAFGVLEARVGELEALKASVAEQLLLEQGSVAALRETLSANEGCIAELRQQVQQEEARTLHALREMSETAAGSQRQISKLEEQHLQEVQGLKDELDKRAAALKTRDQEMVRTNFTLKNEIDRLNAQLEQTKRDAKAYQEQLIASHQAMKAEMNVRLEKQGERYADLSKRHDLLKAQFEQSQREVESWKTKSERLDRALADVNRLIYFARNPPDSARSSLIIRYQACSPPGSKVGSVSHRDGCEDDGDECESASHIPDTDIIGDQLSMPDAADQETIVDAA